MISKHTACLAPILALLLASTAFEAAAQSAVGTNAAIRNSVRMKTAADPALRPARLREAVHLGDAIASGPQSSLQILLRDRSTFTVGSNARLTIDRFVYDPNRGTSDVAASVTRGAFRFMSGNARNGGARSINTPVASMGIRGTIAEGTVGEDTFDILQGQPGLPELSGDAGNATLVVLRGPGPRNDGADNIGAIELTAGGRTQGLDRPGRAVLVLDSGEAFAFEISDEASARLTRLLAPAPAGGDDDGALVYSGNFGEEFVFEGFDIDLPLACLFGQGGAVPGPSPIPGQICG